MEIERCRVGDLDVFVNEGNKENLLKMEIESNNLRKHYSSPLTRNKENLLKMEIERYISSSSLFMYIFRKQRKSPENGD